MTLIIIKLLCGLIDRNVMTPDLFLIKYYYGTDINYDVNSKDSFYETIPLRTGQVLKFTEWDEAKKFIGDITPKYIDFLHSLVDRI